jgi:hypothetical protein
MSHWLIHPTTTITVSDHRALLTTWKSYGGCRNPHVTGLIGGFRVKDPLTAAQLRRLPGELRARLVA